VQDDRSEIVSVPNRCGEACDRRDLAVFDEVFTLDALTECGGAVVAGRDERVAVHGMFGGYPDGLRRTVDGCRISYRRLAVSVEWGTLDVLAPAA
jgi:hypothetical protein